jgi:hypothetical protein
MNEDLLIVDIDQLIRAYEEGLIKSLSNSSLEEIDINSSIGYLPVLIELQRGLSATVVASNNTLENLVQPLVEIKEEINAKKEKSFREIFVNNSYGDCSVTDIDGKRQEEVDFFVNETRSKSEFNLFNEKPAEVFYKKRFTNGVNMNAGAKVSKTLDTWLFGEDGKVFGNQNFGLEKCFNCFIDIKLEFISPALEFLFDLGKMINKIKEILKQIDLDMSPLELMKYVCNFAITFGENLLCPANLKGLNLILPTLFIKYSADLLKFRLDPSIVLGPIIKTIVGSLVSFVENIPRLMFPFIDCIRNAVSTTLQALASLYKSGTKILTDGVSLINKITDAGYKAFLAARRLFETLGIVDSYEAELKNIDAEIYKALKELITATGDYNFLKDQAENQRVEVDNQWVRLLVDFIIWTKDVIDGNINEGITRGVVIGNLPSARESFETPGYVNYLSRDQFYGEASNPSLASGLPSILNSLTYDDLKYISFEKFKLLFLSWLTTQSEETLNIIINAGLPPREIERELNDLEVMYDKREAASKRMLAAEKRVHELIGREAELIETLSDPVVQNKAKIELVAEDTSRKVPDYEAYKQGAIAIAEQDSLYLNYMRYANQMTSAPEARAQVLALAEKRKKEVIAEQMRIKVRPMIYRSTKKKDDLRLSINPRDYGDRGEAAKILGTAQNNVTQTPRTLEGGFELGEKIYGGKLIDEYYRRERLRLNTNPADLSFLNAQSETQGDRWNLADFLLGKYGLDISSNYVEGDYKIFGGKKSSEIISTLNKADAKVTEFFTNVEKLIVGKLDELKNYIQSQVNNIIATFKGFEAFLGEFAGLEISLLGEIKNLLHLIRLFRAVWELITNGLSNCDKIKNNQEVFKSIIEKTKPGTQVKLNESKDTLTFDNSNGSTYTLNPNEVAIIDANNLVKVDLNDCQDVASHLVVNDRNLDSIYEGILNGIYTSN